jgi:hypothetical protein
VQLQPSLWKRCERSNWNNHSVRRVDLFAASLDAGAGGDEEGSGGADYGQDGGRVFRGVGATGLGVEREGGGEQESKTDEQEGRFVHGVLGAKMRSVRSLMDTRGSVSVAIEMFLWAKDGCRVCCLRHLRRSV